ncbi:hypothetical protein QS258_26190, partial [Escherichia coli]|nr:hypothetical protein [Escherichia coli]
CLRVSYNPNVDVRAVKPRKPKDGESLACATAELVRGAKNCRHCASVPVTQTRRNRDRMWECRTAHARSDIP